jgi:hypothetical protein
MEYFDKKIFFKYFLMLLCGLMVGFTIAMFFGYELMPFDIPGSILTAALLANLILLLTKGQEQS